MVVFAMYDMFFVRVFCWVASANQQSRVYTSHFQNKNSFIHLSFGHG